VTRRRRAPTPVWDALVVFVRRDMFMSSTSGASAAAEPA
jgi:hypothetical protein